jgi:uncharacterized membrane protein YoaK (UPF0700 family)
MVDWASMMSGMMSEWGNTIPAPMAAFFAAFLVIGIIICIAMYIYTSLAWYTIAKKLNHSAPWLAWIPIANIALMLQLGGFHWAWVFLLLVPILGWIALAVLIFIATWRVFEKRKYPGWLSLIPLASWIPYVGGLAGIGYMIILGFVAWKDMK